MNARRIQPLRLARLSLTLALGSVGAACNLGPYPDLLEPVDKLQAITGAANGWLLVGDDDTQVLVLGEEGAYLWSTVRRDTSVLAESGTFDIEGGRITFHAELRYDFPKETGPVEEREGAYDEEIDEESLYRAETNESETELTIEGVGTFVSMDEAVKSLDVTTEEGRHCLLRTVQLSVRTAQSRIRGFGGAGLLIYRDNETTFAGLLGGELRIVLDGLTSPVTTMTYDAFTDFPDLALHDAFQSAVDSSGTGEMSGTIRFAYGPEATALAEASPAELDLVFSGTIGYGEPDAIQITEGDVTGGTYAFTLDGEDGFAGRVPNEILQDLDLRGCF